MPHDTTALAGEETKSEQIPISLIRLEIPSNEQRIHDFDQTVYLNPSTNAVSLLPGTGLLAFVPYAGLKVPKIDVSSQTIGSTVRFTVANRNDGTNTRPWSRIVRLNGYREAVATIWQGNLVIPSGAGVDALQVVGAITYWTGVVADIQIAKGVASVELTGKARWLQTQWPYRFYTIDDFPHIPREGTKLQWGGTTWGL